MAGLVAVLSTTALFQKAVSVSATQILPFKPRPAENKFSPKINIKQFDENFKGAKGTPTHQFPEIGKSSHTIRGVMTAPAKNILISGFALSASCEAEVWFDDCRHMLFLTSRDCETGQPASLAKCSVFGLRCSCQPRIHLYIPSRCERYYHPKTLITKHKT
jgi:hypothetical protein